MHEHPTWGMQERSDIPANYQPGHDIISKQRGSQSTQSNLGAGIAGGGGCRTSGESRSELAV